MNDSNKKVGRYITNAIVHLLVEVTVTVLLFFLLAWAVTVFWNKLVTIGFEGVPQIAIDQSAIILLGIYIFKLIIKWW